MVRKDYEELGFKKLEGFGNIHRYELETIYLTINSDTGLTLITNSDIIGLINFKGIINNTEELKHLIASIHADNKLKYELND